MRIKDGFALREINGQGIVVATGKRALAFNGMIRLNEVGTLIWKMLSEGKEEQEMVRQITNEYDVDESTANEDISQLLNKLSAAAILEK